MKTQLTRQMKSLLPALLFALPSTAAAIGAAVDPPWPEGATVTLNLKLRAAPDKDGKARISGDLIITNPGPQPLTVQSPENRQTLVFFVSDELGNPVTPTARGKADPGFTTRMLGSNEKLVHHPDNLDFVTGSSLSGYDLKPGKTYRILAVYRPAGPRGPGFTSGETTLEIPR